MHKADSSSLAESTAHLETLSKEELIGLTKLYSKLFVAVDGFWYLAVKELVDEDTATACDFWVWDKYIRYEFKRLKRLMNIEGDDLAAFATTIRWSPWLLPWTYELTQEGKDKLTFTVLECPTLQAFAKEGAGREKTFCPQVEAQILQTIVEAFNPRGKAIPIVLPPEAREANICCRWQFVIVE